MTVQLLMGLIKIRVFIALVVLVCTLAAVSSKERNSDEEVFLRQIVDPASGEIDEDMVSDYSFVLIVFGYCYSKCNLVNLI